MAKAKFQGASGDYSLGAVKDSMEAFSQLNYENSVPLMYHAQRQVEEAALAWDRVNQASGTDEVKVLIQEQDEIWLNAYDVTYHAMEFYLGPDLGQSANKFGHSLEFAFGVHRAYVALLRVAGYTVSDAETNLILRSAFLHDAGRLWNLSELDNPLIDGQSPRELAMPAAQNIYHKLVANGDHRWLPRNVCEAICYEAISGRKGGVFKAAQAIDEDGAIDKIHRYFNAHNVHNLVHIRGIHNFAAHHDDPALSPGGKNHADLEVHGALDHIGIVMDWACGATGDAKYLDEVALCLLEYARNESVDPAYARFVLEGYGTGDSILETFYEKLAYQARIENGTEPADIDLLVRGLRNKERGQKEFPQLMGPWNEMDDDARLNMATGLNTHGSIAGYMVEALKSLPELNIDRIKSDLAVTNTAFGGNDRPFFPLGPGDHYNHYDR